MSGQPAHADGNLKEKVMPDLHEQIDLQYQKHKRHLKQNRGPSRKKCLPPHSSFVA